MPNVRLKLPGEPVNVATEATLAATNQLKISETETIKVTGTLIEGNAESGHFLFKDNKQRKIIGYAKNISTMSNTVLKSNYVGTFERVVLVAPSGDLETIYTLLELQAISSTSQHEKSLES